MAVFYRQNMHRFKRALFIFRRDLRLHDNTGLLYALQHAKEVIPCFIFTHEQIDRNPYRSDRCLQFMMESLQDLQEQLQAIGKKLYFFLATPEEVIAKFASFIDVVVVNRDYTPYSVQRDSRMQAVCQKLGLA